METNTLSSYFQKLQELASVANASTLPQQTQTNIPTTDTSTDMYIPSGDTGDEILCSDNYNNLANQKSQMMPPPPPPTDVSESEDTYDKLFGVSSISTEEANSSSVLSLIQELSNSLNVDTDSLLSSLNNLGIASSSLSDSSSFEDLISTLNSSSSDSSLSSVSSTDELLATIEKLLLDAMQEDTSSSETDASNLLSNTSLNL